MRSTFDRVNVVYVRLHVLGELSAVLHCNVVLRSFFFTRYLNHVTVQGIACPVEMFHKFDQATLVLKVATLSIPFVMELDVDTTIEESEFLQAFIEGVKVVLGDAENLVVSLECRLGTCLLSRSTLADRTGRNPTLIFLSPCESITTDFSLGPLTQKVDHGNTNTVQTT